MDGGTPNFRLARCPKCLKLLVEYADIPVYHCAACGATLRAKNRTAPGEHDNSRLVEADHSQSLSEIGSSANGSTSACSTDAHSSELDHEEKETMLPNVCSPYSSAKCNHQENGETSGENGIEENGSETNRLAVGSDASQSQPDEGVHSKAEAEKSLKLSRQHCGSSDVMNKVEEPPKSVSQSVASEEDMVERGSADVLDLSFRSPATRSSHAYDGSISSADDGYNSSARDRYLRLSRRTYRQPKAWDTADNKGKECKEVSGSNQIAIEPRTLSSKLSNERHGSGIMRMHEPVRETSFESEDFHSVRDWMEPENDGPSRSLSRGSQFHHDSFNSRSSKYLRYGGMDLSRKIDELKNQLLGLCNQSVDGGKTYLRGIDGQQPLYQKPEHQPPQCFNPNLLHHPPEAIHGPRQITFRRYQFPQMPLSGQRCCSSLHCCPEDRQLQLQPNRRTDGICRAYACNLCSHSSTAGSSGTPDQEQEKLRCNERRKRRKNHCRPISGGAPFMICYNCFELLQLPADFLISRRRLNKLQCAACSQVLELSFPAIVSITPQSPGKVVHPCNKAGNCMDVATGSVSHSNEYPRGDPVCLSEVYGISFTKSFSTEAKPALHVSRNAFDDENDEQKSGLPLHRLMGYSSARQLVYQYGDLDEGYESIESMIPHSYRPSEESHAIDGWRKQRMSTSCHEQIGPCTDPDCMEIQEEEKSPRPLRARRGSLLHDGLELTR